MNKQRGFTLLTLFFLLILAGMGAWVAFKVVPTYIDYYTIRQVLRNALEEDSERSNVSLRQTITKRLNVNFIRGVTGQDVVIERANGMLTLTVPINRKEHLAGGISVAIDLEAQASTPMRE